MKTINITRRIAITSLAVIAMASISATASAQSVGSGMKHQAMAQQQAELGLEGYCPVCVVEHGKWVMGKAEHAAEFDGVNYYFPSEEVKAMFQKNPAAYVPALGGDCTVCYAMAGKRMPGNIRFAAVDNKRLFLFPSDKERQAFWKSPEKFAAVDLGADGNCIVCKVKAGKDVPGDEQFTAVHDGFRYLFPSDRERQMFINSPEQFLSTTTATSDNMHSGLMTGKAMQTSAIQVQGRSACAACEFGVTPINAPEELGYAITTQDGRVFVIEDVHTRWPQLYKARFDGNAVAVSGDVIKTEGRFTWIKPANIKTL